MVVYDCLYVYVCARLCMFAVFVVSILRVCLRINVDVCVCLQLIVYVCIGFCVFVYGCA